MRKVIISILAASIMLSVVPVVSFASYDSDVNELAKITYNYDGEDHTRYMEKLDRGLVAVKTDSGVFLSWRLLGYEASVKDIINAPDFEIYRNNTRIATVDNSTNYLDQNGTESDSYSVKIVGGEISDSVIPNQNNYFDIELAKPDPFTYTEGENSYSYEYTAGDASCGDLDGDGQYEIVLKWDSNPQDNSNGGVTGNVLLDAYKLDGTRLWDKPIDLGRNIRAGAHYTQFLVYDFDGDGKAEITCKTAPGSKDTKDAYVTAVSDDSTIRSADNSASYDPKRSGYILDGPEYFTIFNGDGVAVDTINYPVARVNASTWGDAYGNRVDRFIADVSYLDGEKPYAVYWRGYYFGQSGSSGRCGVFAASFDGKRLSVPEDHIFDTRSGQPGYTAGNERYVGEGNHNMTSGDFDDDGKDEFTAGALAFEFDNNKLVPMWCTYKEHGDAIHIGDYDPTHTGLELFVVHEDGGGTNSYGGVYNDFGCSVVDPSDGSIMWHVGASKDTGRGLMANVGAGGYYQVTAASGVGGYYSLGGGNMQKGTAIGYNFRTFWDADLYDETLDGTTVSAWDGIAMSPIFNTANYDCVSINGTKSVPVLQADLFGDWREELVYPTRDSSKLRIFTTTDLTEYKLPTLMHDPIYRSGVASEQSGYNQPPHIGFYLADEIFRAAVDHIEITQSPDKTTYYVGETLDTAGLQVIAHFTDGSTDDVSEHVMVSGYDPMAAGEQSITVTYSRKTAEFKVFVDAGFTVDNDNYITGYTLGSESAIIPDTISGQPINGIRSGALVSSGLKEITINADEMDIEGDAFPDGIIIKCMLGSEVYIYAVNNGIELKIIDTREYTFDVKYDEDSYSTPWGIRMAGGSQDRKADHIHYFVGGRIDRNTHAPAGDGHSGFEISIEDGNNIMRGCVGRFYSAKRNAYFIFEDMPMVSSNTDTVFKTDIRFDNNNDRVAMINVYDTTQLSYYNNTSFVLTPPVDTISMSQLSVDHGIDVDEDVWYTYKLICHNGKYYRVFGLQGTTGNCVLLGDCSSEYGAMRFDFVRDYGSADIENNQEASISLDNTSVYTNVEISKLTLEVTDDAGNAIPKAKISIGGEEYSADRNGIYSSDILSGVYDVNVSVDGYNSKQLTVTAFKGAVEKTIALDIIRYPLESISFAKNIALKEGQTAKTELVTIPENAEKTVFIYSSSDESVATVDESGTVTAIKAGKTTITAKAQDNAEIKAECEVTVYEPYNSIVASIVIDGPDTAYIPNNSASNLVQFAAHCYDKNGVEIKNVNGIKWTANGALAMSAGGVLTVPKGKNAATYTVYASYDGIKSNEEQITLITYPEDSDIIAYEDCAGTLKMAQTKETQTNTLGDITYNVGARGDGGDGTTGFTIGNYSGRKCLYAKAGQFASAGREAYMVFDKIKDAAYYDPALDYILESDIYCTGNEKIIFEDNAGTDIMQLEPGIAGMNTKTWYHYMLIYSGGKYTQYVTDANGNYVDTQLPTLMNDGVISQLRFAKGDTNNETIYFYGLKYYTAESAFSTITVNTVDTGGAALAGITVNVSGNKAVTDANGAAKFTLPLGAYTASATKGEYSASAGVMSTGLNAKYTLVLGETETEPVTTEIDQVIGKTIYASTNGEGLKLYAAKYTNGVLSDISVFDAVNGTSYYNSSFEPDKVFLWDTMQRPTDIWTK